jgi:hypothetical protein
MLEEYLRKNAFEHKSHKLHENANIRNTISNILVSETIWEA